MDKQAKLEIYRAFCVELTAAVARLGVAMPAAPSDFVFMAGMGYFAEMLVMHHGMDKAVAAIDAMAEHGHDAVLKEAATTRH